MTLGKSGVKVTRLAFGTGTHERASAARPGAGPVHAGWCATPTTAAFASSRPPRSYGEMHKMLGVALKGIPRDSYRLMSKVTTHEGVRSAGRRSTSCASSPTPITSTSCCCTGSTLPPGRPTPRAGRTAFWKPQAKKAVVGHGASVHGLPALRQFPGNKWLEIAMIRMNHKGTQMDAEDYNTDGPGNVSEVVTHVKQVRTEGMGVISMKLVGEGAFTTREDRQAAMRFAFKQRGRRLRDGWLQEHGRDRRSHRESESGARLDMDQGNRIPSTLSSVIPEVR